MLLENMDVRPDYASLGVSETPDISVVVPVYNEEKNVGEVLRGLAKTDCDPYSMEIITVDDGSTDNSASEIATFPFVKHIRHTRNMGKGAALRTGFRNATGRVVVVQDSDLEYSPEYVLELAQPILQGKADVVFGSRFNGRYKGMSLSHYLGNKLLSLTARLIFDTPITDLMTGSKAFSREVMNTFHLHENGFGIEVEMTSNCLKNGWRFHEIPIDYSYRTVGSSKIRFSDGIKSLIKLLTTQISKISLDKK